MGKSGNGQLGYLGIWVSGVGEKHQSSLETKREKMNRVVQGSVSTTLLGYIIMYLSRKFKDCVHIATGTLSYDLTVMG